MKRLPRLLVKLLSDRREPERVWLNPAARAWMQPETVIGPNTDEGPYDWFWTVGSDVPTLELIEPDTDG